MSREVSAALRTFSLPAGMVWLALLVGAAYAPVRTASFVWDDDVHVTRNATLTQPGGLKRIWFEPGATPQYYPLVHSTFWLEQRLWGFHPAGYHLVNLALHAASTCLLFWILRRWSVPGAWFAAALFAVHPVQVESVAWVTERKNVLSGFFYLLAAATFVARREVALSRRFLRLLLAAGFCAAFLLALLSKTVTAVLPLALLIAGWWKTGTITRRDAALCVPLLLPAFAMGVLTVWLERVSVGAIGHEWQMEPLRRLLLSGSVPWFYAAKLIWPFHLSFVYPRWSIDPALLRWYLGPSALLALGLLLWGWRRRLGRGPLATLLFFLLHLVPASGWFNVYPFRYSYLADHFQYLACMGLLVAGAAGIEHAARPRPHLKHAGCALLLLLLAGLSFQRTRAFASAESLWLDTLRKNPGAWMAHTHLGLLALAEGRTDEAARRYRMAIAVNPDHAESYVNLANLLARDGKSEEAEATYLKALRVDPTLPAAHYNYGCWLADQGRLEPAERHLREILRYPAYRGLAHLELGDLRIRQSREEEALEEYQSALRLDPSNVAAHSNLGIALLRLNRPEDARAAFERALELDPTNAGAHRNLGSLLAAQGRMEQAVAHLAAAADGQPEDPGTHYNLGMVLMEAGHPRDAIACFEQALRLRPGWDQARQSLEQARSRAEMPQE